MNKWTKGLLIFGVSASIIGTCAVMTGVATGEVQGLLKLSDKAVYETTWQENTICQTVDKLDIALDKHSVDIVESPDNQITYHLLQTVNG